MTDGNHGRFQAHCRSHPEPRLATRGVLACALWPLSLLFGALAALRRLLFALGIKRAERLPVPVIVVGNVFVGGHRQDALCDLADRGCGRPGLHPGVISRGYGGRGADAGGHARFCAAQVGDEPLLIAQRTGVPLVVGRRVAAARSLLAAHPEVDVIISDDGLQHYAGARYRNRALRCARRGQWLAAAGRPLREPASRRRDFSVLNAGLQGKAPAGVHAMRLQADEAVQLAPPARASRWTMGEGGVRWRRWPASAIPSAFSPCWRGPAWPARLPCPTITTSPSIPLQALPPMSS
jgi:tetraacyldisaccharide 4'-kinase